MLRFNFYEREETLIEKALQPDLILAVLLFITVVGALIYSSAELSSQISSLSSEKVRLIAELNRLKAVQVQKKKLEQQKKILEEKLKVISELNAKRKVPDFITFFALRKNVPYGVWLTSVKQSGNTTLAVEANAKTLNLMSNFIENIEGSLGNVKLKYSKLRQFRTETKNFSFQTFKIDVELKK